MHVPFRLLLFSLLILALGWSHSLSALAHSEHQHKTKVLPSVKASPSKTATPEPRTSAAIQISETISPTKSGDVHQTSSSSPHPGHDHEAIAGPSSWSKALWGHWHHKVIHFPLALGVFAALLLIAGLKWNFCYPVAGVALGIAFVFGVAAYFSGQTMLADFSETSPYLPLVERHRQLGIASIVFLGLGAIGVWFKRIQTWMWIYGLILIILLSVTGFYGGWIAHG